MNAHLLFVRLVHKEAVKHSQKSTMAQVRGIACFVLTHCSLSKQQIALDLLVRRLVECYQNDSSPQFARGGSIAM